MLANHLGIGRMPVREALQRLARERLVKIMPRRGIVVTDIDAAAQLRLLEVRREIERLMARSAAKRASQEQRAAFGSLAEEMMTASRTLDDLLFLRKDAEFNALLLESARNEFAAGAVRLMNGVSRRFWYRHYRQVADLSLTAKLHAKIARAIADRCEAEAAAALDELIDYLETMTRATVSPDV